MKRTAIIDYSGVANRAWHTIKSQKGWVFPTELEEGRTRIAKLLLALKSSIGWDQAYLAMDRRDENKKYWRHYVLEDWYAKSTKHGMAGEHLWVLIDGVWMRPPLEGEGSKPIKLTKKYLKDVGETEVRLVEATEIDPQYKVLIPYYKHSRDNKQWAYETDEKTVRMMWGGVADSVAHLIGAKTIRVPGYEADDIAAVFADLKGRESELVFITADSDWAQLCLRPNTSMFDLNKGIWSTRTEDEIRTLTREKIICGDSGDCIPPTLAEGDVRITPSKLGELKPTEETATRNRKLIELRGTPEVEQLVRKAIKEFKPRETTWHDLGISDIEREWLEQKAAVDTLTNMWAEQTFVPVGI